MQAIERPGLSGEAGYNCDSRSFNRERSRAYETARASGNGAF